MQIYVEKLEAALTNELLLKLAQFFTEAKAKQIHFLSDKPST